MQKTSLFAILGAATVVCLALLFWPKPQAPTQAPPQDVVNEIWSGSGNYADIGYYNNSGAYEWAIKDQAMCEYTSWPEKHAEQWHVDVWPNRPGCKSRITIHQ